MSRSYHVNGMMVQVFLYKVALLLLIFHVYMPFVSVFGDFLKITLAVARIGWNHLSHRHSTLKYYCNQWC